MIYKDNRDIYTPEERQSKQLKFLAFAFEGRYDIIRSALFEDDEARYEEACVLTNVEDFPAFCRLFPNSITIVKTSNAKQSRPTAMATLLGKKILFSVGDSIIITSVYCAV